MKQHPQLRSYLQDQATPSKQYKEDVKLFYGKGGRENNDVQVRIRGRSNSKFSFSIFLLIP